MSKIFKVGKIGKNSEGVKPKTSRGKGRKTREYWLWYFLLMKCYHEKYHNETDSTFKDYTVCERWHTFANFLEDLPLIENYELWKNFLLYGHTYDLAINSKSKVFSLDTCKFVSID